MAEYNNQVWVSRLVLANLCIYALDIDANQGRSTPIISGYRPNHWFGQLDDRGNRCFLMGYIDLLDQDELLPQHEAQAWVEFVLPAKLLPQIEVGKQWKLYEGSHLVGDGVVLEILN